MMYFVGTPIGNLDDFTKRGKEVLKEADVVLAEDTRQAKKLLDSLKIPLKEIISFNEHTEERKLKKILEIAKESKVAFICDAGTPNISDPGAKLIKALRENGLEFAPIPGVSAIATIISVCDIPMDKFTFLGFPPAKRKRKKFFEEIFNSPYPVIIYESPHRIIRTMKDLQEFEDFECVVGRELTKKFETIYFGKISEIIDSLEAKGEFTMIIKR